MTNTYFAPGDATPEELIAGVERGLYAVSFGGGQVEPATGDFVFGVSEGYLIENGKVTAPVRGATLIGNGLEALRAIDGIAGDLAIATGFCGKGGQQVPGGRGPAARPHPRAHRGRDRVDDARPDLERGRAAVEAAAGGRRRRTPRRGPRRPRAGAIRVYDGRGREPAATPAAAASACARSSDGRCGLRLRHGPDGRGRARSSAGAAREAAERGRPRRVRRPARRSSAPPTWTGSPRRRSRDWTTERKVELALAVERAARARDGRHAGRGHGLLRRRGQRRARQLARLRGVATRPRSA